MEPALSMLKNKETVVVAKAIDELARLLQNDINCEKYVKRQPKDVYFVLMAAFKQYPVDDLEKTISILGQCLNNDCWVKILTQAQCEIIMEELCLVIQNTTKKTICARALRCFCCQKFDATVITPKITAVLTSISSAIDGSRLTSCSVACEAIKVISNLLNVLPLSTLKYHNIWWRSIVGLLVHPSPKVKERSLNFLTEHKDKLREEPGILHFLTTAIATKKILIPQLLELFNGEDDLYVLKVWKWFIDFFERMMHQGSSLINCLLEVIQKAFKSPIEKVRVGAYENWKELIDNFANELDILSNVKRLTLLLQPLRLNNGHSESILKVKMQTWWHLIVCLGPKLQPNIDLVLIPLINFCFRTDDSPQTRQALGKSASFGSNFNNSSVNDNKCDENNVHDGQNILLMRYGIHFIARLLQTSGFSPAECTVPFLLETLTSLLLEPLRYEAISDSLKFIKLSKHIFQAIQMSSGISWTDKGDIELLLYIWQSLISFTRAMANTSIHQNEFSSFIAAFFSAIDALLKEPSVDITMLFEILEAVSFLPSVVFSTPIISLKDGHFFDGAPSLILLRSLLSQKIVCEFGSSMRFIVLFTHLTTWTSHSSLTPLVLIQSLVHLLEKEMHSHLPLNLCCKLWSIMATNLESFVSETQEVNQGDSLQHDFGCIQSMLLFPFRHFLQHPIINDLKCDILKKWLALCEIFITCSSSIHNVNPNVGCLELMSKLHEIICSSFQKRRLLMDELEILLKVVDTLVTLIKWDSLQNATEGSVILRISRRMTITRGYDLTPLLQMVSLITEVLADFRKIDGQSDSLATDNAGLLLEILKKIFGNLQASNLISLVLHFSPDILNIVQMSSDSISVFNDSNIVSMIDELWVQLMKNIVDSYNGPYNNNLLRVISPLLEAGLQHERDCLRLSSRRLWEETFALSACKLFVPPLLRKLLEKKEPKHFITHALSRGSKSVVLRLQVAENVISADDNCDTQKSEINNCKLITVQEDHLTSDDGKIPEKQVEAISEGSSGPSLNVPKLTPNNERKSCLKVCEVSISASGKNSPVIDQNCHTLPLKQVDDCDVTIGNLNCDFVNDKQEKNVTDARDLSTTDYCDSFKDASGSNESDVSFFNRIGNEMQLETNAPYHFEKCECPLKLPVVEVEKLTTRDIEKVKSLLQNIRNDSTASSKDVECDPSGISSPLTAEIDSCPLNPNNDDFDEVESRMAIHSRSQDFNDSVTNNNGPELLKDINSSLYSDYPKNNPVIVKDFQSKQTIVLPIDKISTLTESESQGTSYCLEAVPSNPLNDSSNTNNQINPRRGNYCNGNCGKLVTSSSKRCLCFLGDSYSRRHLSPAKRVDCRNEVEVVTSTINGHQSFEDESVQVNDHGNMLRHQQDELLYSSVKGPSNLLESPFERNALSNSVICETNNSSNEKRPGTGSSSETDSDTSELSIEAGSGANNSYSDSVTNIPSLHFTTTNISSIDSFTEVNDSSFESVESSENDGVNHINDLIFNSVCDITSTTKQHPNILKESEFLLCNEHKNPVVFSQDESLDERSQPCHSQESNGIAISQSPKPPVQEVIVIESDSDISINEKSTVKTRSAAKKTNQTRGAQMLKLSKNISCTKNDVNLSMIAEKNCSDFVEPLESVGLRASDELMNNSIQKELSPALSKSPSIGKPSNKDERFLPTPLSSRCSPLASPLCQSPCSPSGILKRKTLMSDALTPTTPNKRKVSFADPVVQEEVTFNDLSRNCAKQSVNRCLYMTKNSRSSSTFVVSPQKGSPKNGHRCQESLSSCEEKAVEEPQDSHSNALITELNHKECVFPELVYSEESIDMVLPLLTCSLRSRSLKRVFLAKNISTVGQLSKLTETEIQSLPIRSPKVKVVFQALASVIKTSAELSDKGKETTNKRTAVSPTNDITSDGELAPNAFLQSVDQNDSPPTLEEMANWSPDKAAEEMPVLRKQSVLESRTSAITDPFQPLLQYIDEYMEKFTSDSLSNVSPSMMVDFHASIADRVAAFSKKWLNSQNCA